MYESFFGLNRRPFSTTPDPKCFVSLTAMQAALGELVLCVEGGQGIGILTAPAGVGKSQLCRKLVADLSDRFAIAFLPTANFSTPRALLQAVLCELGGSYLRMAEQELRLEFVKAVKHVRPKKEAVLLVVDEAHLLNTRLLEELRIATNIAEDGLPLVRIVLSGQMLLEEKLAAPALAAFNQRIRCHVSLEPLSRSESAEYLARRVIGAGGQIANIFTAEAVQTICHVSDGLPRCINQLADHSLLLGYFARQKPVNAETVRKALDTLKQLPLHWNDLQHSVEFGVREDVAAANRNVDFSPREELQADNHRTMDLGPHDEFSAGDDHGDSTPRYGIEVGAAEPAGDAYRVPAENWLEDESTEWPAVVEIGGDAVQVDAVNDPDTGLFDPEPSATARVSKFTPERSATAGVSQVDPNPRVTAEVSEPSIAIGSGFIGRVAESRAEWKPCRVFEEERIVDRYALLDAGRELPHALENEPIVVRSVDFNSRGDQALPASADAFEMDSESRLVGQSSGGSVAEDEPMDEGFDEEIGASLLEICRETHQAITDQFIAQYDTDADYDYGDGIANAGDDEFRYDVVEPEPADSDEPWFAENSSRPGGPLEWNSPDEKPAAGGRESNRHPQFDQLFTRLRKQQERPPV